MGADLYIESIYKKNHARYNPTFEYWATIRDALRKAGNEAATEKAQKQVWKYYDKIHQQGYFRDGYNDYNLLWVFDLSWWTDTKHLIDRQGWMMPIKIKRFFKMLKKREAVFEANVKQKSIGKSETSAEVEVYFRKKYQELKTFLQEAIRRNEPIRCSI